jgi:pimeloyl-ACP methyl ester carboxylesterase
MMIASPMDASGFASLVEHFRDRTVVTYDPCGVGRSQRTDGASWPTPEQHADDLHRLISAPGGGPVHIFASSGGAVNGLALVAGTRIRCGRWWRTSRRPPRPCRTASRRWAAAPDRPARRHPPRRGDQHPALASPRHRGRWPRTGCAFPTHAAPASHPEDPATPAGARSVGSGDAASLMAWVRPAYIGGRTIRRVAG